MRVFLFYLLNRKSSRELSRPWKLTGRLLRVYRCQLCGGVVPPNTPAIRQVAETRQRKYPFRAKANRFRKDGRIKESDDPGGVGYETVREIVVCPGCSKEVSGGRAEGSDPPGLTLAA